MIGKIILDQLGGGGFLAMTGARDLIYGESYLMFSLPIGFAKNGINMVKITLDWTDTYIFEAMKVSAGVDHKSELIEKLEYIYADQLEAVFTRVTGLDTHL